MSLNGHLLDVFLLLDSIYVFGRNIREVMLCPHRVVSGSMQCKFILPLKTIWITWIGRCLQDSWCKVTLLWSLICSLWEDTLKLLKYFFLLQLSPTGFSMYLFLPELFISCMATKWWVSNYIIASIFVHLFSIIRKHFPISSIYLFTYL